MSTRRDGGGFDWAPRKLCLVSGASSKVAIRSRPVGYVGGCFGLFATVGSHLANAKHFPSMAGCNQPRARIQAWSCFMRIPQSDRQSSQAIPRVVNSLPIKCLPDPCSLSQTTRCHPLPHPRLLVSPSTRVRALRLLENGSLPDQVPKASGVAEADKARLYRLSPPPHAGRQARLAQAHHYPPDQPHLDTEDTSQGRRSADCGSCKIARIPSLSSGTACRSCVLESPSAEARAA